LVKKNKNIHQKGYKNEKDKLTSSALTKTINKIIANNVIRNIEFISKYCFSYYWFIYYEINKD